MAFQPEYKYGYRIAYPGRKKKYKFGNGMPCQQHNRNVQVQIWFATERVWERKRGEDKLHLKRKPKILFDFNGSCDYCHNWKCN